MPINFSNYKPSTLTEAVDTIYESLSVEEFETILKHGITMLHHGFGTVMRNSWGLWNSNSRLSQYFRDVYGLSHADDMSGLILESLEAKVKGLPYNPWPTVEKYLKHWKEFT